jgi:poly(3-hydroxyalkanoate) depolymerase
MLDYLDYGQVNAVGVSWGGALAQQFAYDYPERCKKLILAATAAGAFMVPGKPKVLWLMASPRRYIQPSHVVRIAPMIYGGSFRRDSKLAAEHASKVRSAGKLGYYWQLFAGLGWTSIHWLHKINQPTLVLAHSQRPTAHHRRRSSVPDYPGRGGGADHHEVSPGGTPAGGDSPATRALDGGGQDDRTAQLGQNRLWF